MKTSIIIYLSFVFLIISVHVNANPDPPAEGKTIFSTRCASCHNVNKVLVGPALAGVDERRSIDWIINFVHSSQKMVKSGNADAVALFEKFNRIPMPDHPDLTEENIKNVVEFIKSESKPAAASEVPFAKLSKRQPNYLPLSISKDAGFFISYFTAVLMFIGVMLFAVHTSSLNQKA